MKLEEVFLNMTLIIIIKKKSLWKLGISLPLKKTNLKSGIVNVLTMEGKGNCSMLKSI